jgi:hypothetical protein
MFLSRAITATRSLRHLEYAVAIHGQALSVRLHGWLSKRSVPGLCATGNLSSGASQKEFALPITLRMKLNAALFPLTDCIVCAASPFALADSWLRINPTWSEQMRCWSVA